MLLIALRKGGAKCSSACPFYEESGVVRGINGPLKTHCSMTMNPWMIAFFAFGAGTFFGVILAGITVTLLDMNEL